jgi:Cof subfamily protein (haloacid dehalogenase superfamily)
MPELLPNWHSLARFRDLESIRDFSRIRLIVLDLDGTIISSRISFITGRIQALQRQLNHPSKQVKITIATGRTLFGVETLLRSLPLPTGRPLILYNGSVVIKNRTLDLIHRMTISSSDLSRILTFSLNYPVRVFAYAYLDEKAEAFMQNSEPERVLGWTTVNRIDREFNGKAILWQENCLEGEIYPSAVLIDTTLAPTAALEIEAGLLCIDNISITRSGSTYIEIRPKNSNKAVALQKVAVSMALKREEILALGDNDNDAEMLAWAGIGVAVAQSSKAAQEHSDYICHFGVAEGVAEVLSLVCEAKRLFPKDQVA